MASAERPTRDAAGSTIPDPEDGRTASVRGMWARRVGVGVLAVFVLVGLVGGFGVRSNDLERQGEQVTARLHHPQIARPGLAVHWQIVVESPEGLDEPIVIRQRSDYFTSFDFNGMEPSPASSTSDGGWIEWEWDAPPSTDFQVTVDGRVEPGVQMPLPTETEVEAQGETLRFDYRTWVVP